MRTIYDEVYHNAIKLFDSRFSPLERPVKFDSQEWANWVNCWFEALDNLHELRHNEGLTQTADYILQTGQEQWNICHSAKADYKYLENMYARYNSRVPQSY